MARIVRLSALAVWSMALLPIGLSGCDQGPETATHVGVSEQDRKQAEDKQREFMQKQKGQKPGSRP